MVRKILLGLLLLAVGLQFFRGTAPAVVAENPADLIENNQIPQEVSTLLQTSCYDCHSNQTVYPWYSYIYPVSDFLYKHVEEGREELNFSEWETMKKRTRIRKLNDIAEEIEDGKMPLKSYERLHPSASLTEGQKERIMDWTKSFGEAILGE